MAPYITPASVTLGDGQVVSVGVLSFLGAMQAEAEAATPPEGVPADTWHGLCRLARRVSPPMTGPTFGELPEADALLILKASKEVDARAASFRADRQPDPPGAVPGGQGHGVV